MKKILSILLSVIMIFSAATPVFAATQSASSSQISAVKTSVDEDIQGELKFLNITPTLSGAVDAYTVIRADKSMAHGFLTELDVNLAKNSGKIIVNSAEDVVVYAAVINILSIIGEDPADYKGYDIKSAFEALDMKGAVTNPYYYRVVVEACKAIDNKTLAHSYIDEFIDSYYKLGEGMDYWGVSCDNTAAFLTAIAPYKNDYKSYVTDAKKVIATYTTADGCFYSKDYSDLSADSTAVAMMAYGAIGDYDMAYKLYNNLMDGFESETDNGVIFCYGSNNAYATKEALLALTYFDSSKLVHHYDEVWLRPSPTCVRKGVKVSICSVCGYENKETLPALGSKYHKPICTSTDVKATYFTAGKTAGYVCEDCGAVISKAKTVAKKAPKINKATSNKKAISLDYTKVSGAKGYQICFSKSKSFKTQKTFTVKGNKSKIAGLSKNKTYYVKVRAYKLVKGKKVYSSWSTVKAVKVK